MSPFFSAPSRRTFLKQVVSSGSAVTLYPALAAARAVPSKKDLSVPEVPPFELDEITIAELQDGMNSGKFTARSLVEKYSARIDEVDKHGPAVNAVIEMNRDAMSIADGLDRERRA